jgi:hypothetical protein
MKTVHSLLTEQKVSSTPQQHKSFFLNCQQEIFVAVASLHLHLHHDDGVEDEDHEIFFPIAVEFCKHPPPALLLLLLCSCALRAAADCLCNLGFCSISIYLIEG